MKKIYDYFIDSKEDLTHLQVLKARFFVVLNFGVFALALVYILTTVLFKEELYFVNIVPPLAVALIPLVGLWVLKHRQLQKAFNLLVTVLVILQALSITVLRNPDNTFNTYVDGYYVLFAFFTLVPLFADRLFFIINSAMVIIAAFLAHYLSPDFADDQLQAFADRAVVIFMVALSGAGMVLFFIGKIFAEALAQSKQEMEKAESDNNKRDNVLKTVESLTKQLEVASEELKNTSSELTNSSSLQASNVEEMSAALEEMTNSIEENSSLAKSGIDDAGESEDYMKKSEKALIDIIESVKRINKHVNLIDELSFQTNILSLNASIEAARAGSAGKGFSVVASEVGALAEKSKAAASVISEIVQDNNTKADTAQHALHSMFSVISNGMKNSEKISSAVLEQKTGIGSINHAINEVNEAAQNNAGYAERLNNGSLILKKSVDKLKQIVQESV